ncbi:MAG: CBS domain-containing protein [Opitutae bacterium]|jgi:CBS domain containing-hemolysin-like protein|nr:CBS domain-containing protein [Opitutae bacterium]MBT5715640.1 CBS domain-containing protein [Opitutae bacterium]
MSEFLFLFDYRFFLLLSWLLLSIWGLYVNTFRALVDRVRAGVSSLPVNRVDDKLLHSLLAAPNHERPFHIEAALLSSLQIILGTITFYTFLKQGVDSTPTRLIFYFLVSTGIAFLWERTWTGIASHSIAASSFLSLHLTIGKPFMVLIQIVSFPLSLILLKIERLMRRMADPRIEVADEKNELADHIRTLSRESSTLDPEVFEIVGNTLEMGHLHVRDVLVPRNQVQVLDCQDSIEENLQIVRTCGHTRLPICEGDLDHCIGIIHVKYAFRLLTEGKKIDLRKLSKTPAIVSTDDPLPVALKKMMRWKIHMALVQDEFGGIDGVITLEDILEEVVGEIQDEFDAEENTVQKSGVGKWKVSGLSPIHELPEELGVEEEEELTSFGGHITKELGRIPEVGEVLKLKNLQITILDADETRVQLTEVTLLSSNNETIS